jgi:multicomponent Na+:H+ antiporter subunit D
MDAVTDILLVGPFAALIMANIFPRKARPWAGITACAMALTAQIAFCVLYPFGIIEWSPLVPIQNVIGFTLSLDNLSLLLILSAAIAGLTALVVCGATMRASQNAFIFTNLILLCTIGMNGIALVRDLFSLYVFIELTAAAAFILITVLRGRDAYEGLWKYLILSFVAALFMLTAIALFLLFTGSVSMQDAAAAFATPGSPAWIAGVLYFCGLFIKGGIVPFHGWLADAYTGAPSAVSAFLAGIVTKASGLFALMRFAMSPIGAQPFVREIFLAAGTVSAVAGAFLSLGQKDMKRMLAYSSVSQMGYIVLALGGDPSLAVLAASLHFFVHAISKAQLFSNAAAVEGRLGTMDMDRMGGLGSRMPVTAGTVAVATLSVAGLPPLAGFWTKLLIVISLWRAGQYVYAVIAVLTSLLTIAYFISLIRRVFFGKTEPQWAGIKEAGLGLLAPVTLLSTLSIGIGVAFPLVLRLLTGGAP